jgi:CheY-like chemotaxis protein
MHSYIKELYSLQSAINQLHLTTHENEKMHREISAEMEKTKFFLEGKAEFLNSMNHEINTPLATLGIIIHLIKQTNLDDKQKAHVARLTLSVDYLRTLMERVLKMSRMEANRLELESIPFNLNELVDEVFLILEPVASRKHIGLHTNVDQNVPRTLVGDRLNVKEILINFATNAIKFTSTGEVNIKVEIESRDKNTAIIVLSVADSGCGIAADHLPLLFQRFSQINNRTFAGNGLGLAITKGLAELMGGTVGVISREGMGSTFWAKIPFEFLDSGEHDALQSDEILPGNINNAVSVSHGKVDGELKLLLEKIYICARNDMPESAAIWFHSEAEIMESLGQDGVNIGDLFGKFKLQQAADSLSLILGKQTGEFDALPILDGRLPLVLLIDDTPGNLEFLSLLFQKFATVKVAADSDRGIEIAKTCSGISLIILDVSMPIKDGFEVIKELKESPVASGIPVIMISASETHNTRQRCMASGAAEFINRNKAPDEIETLVQTYLCKST